MHSYFPHSEAERREMLKAIGVDGIDALFADVPEALRLKRPLDIEGGLSEFETAAELARIASDNTGAGMTCFLGGGVYDHYIPAVIPSLLSRQEFYTAYTPYQAEISQGTLQSIFEFQTLVSRLCGMDVANASMYDGASACAEAMFMAEKTNDRNEIILLKSVNPEYIEVCRGYARFRGIKLIEAEFDQSTGQCDVSALKALLNENTAAVIAQSPNYFGVIEDIGQISEAVKANGSVMIAAADPISLGILKPPGECGADIAVGEGQPLGNPMSFGGPGLGFLACKQDFLRKLPGRIVGETRDNTGNRGFVLTMQAREQHIRREKATSNICSNQALCALAAGMYMTLLGKDGMREAAGLCWNKSNYLYKRLLETGRFEPVYSAPFFREFTIKYKGDTGKLAEAMRGRGILHGVELGGGRLLVAVTEKRTKREMDAYVEIAIAGGAL